MTSTSCSTFWASHIRPPPPSLRRPLPDAAHWRLFVAAPLPEVAAARAWEALAQVRTLHPQARWLSPNKLHLTLAFLGPSDPGGVDSISAAIARVARSHHPFDVATADAGGRLGGRGGGVAWLRLADGGPEAGQLSLELDAAIGAHGYDANNAPRPHLTVVRGVSGAGLADLRHVADALRITWPVDRVVLFRSHTDPRGSRYIELASAALGALPAGRERLTAAGAPAYTPRQSNTRGSDREK